MSRRGKRCHDASEVFELSIAEPMTGMELARSGRDIYWEKWRYCGGEMIELETKRFKLIRFDHLSNLEAAVSAMRDGGYKAPYGQWLHALKKSLPDQNNTAISIASPFWRDEVGRIRYPRLDCSGNFRFGHANDYFLCHQRWLIEVE
ncbi:MAG: hypothetical protein EXS60_02145 [Candidatus Pacebacteria bacterium]|nr:hypothetical protein [Candidatus Paceibacterota bacterium]